MRQVRRLAKSNRRRGKACTWTPLATPNCWLPLVKFIWLLRNVWYQIYLGEALGEVPNADACRDDENIGPQMLTKNIGLAIAHQIAVTFKTEVTIEIANANKWIGQLKDRGACKYKRQCEAAIVNVRQEGWDTQDKSCSSCCNRLHDGRMAGHTCWDTKNGFCCWIVSHSWELSSQPTVTISLLGPISFHTVMNRAR